VLGFVGGHIGGAVDLDRGLLLAAAGNDADAGAGAQLVDLADLASFVALDPGGLAHRCQDARADGVDVPRVAGLSREQREFVAARRDLA
jgi:hypothetical protein